MMQILFVCLGNICRSPALMGYLNHLLIEKGSVKEAYIDSCGLHPTFIGAPPNQQMQVVAKERGVSLHHRAKLFEIPFFDSFDLIFGVTHGINSHLQSLSPSKEAVEKIHLVTEYSQNYMGIDMPDPYDLGIEGFRKVWDMIEDCCRGIYKRFLSEESN